MTMRISDTPGDATDPEVFEVLVTAAQAWPAFERAVLGAKKEVRASFRIFDFSTALLSPEARAIGETWADLVEHIVARGVDFHLVISDFDPVMGQELHQKTKRSVAQAQAIAARLARRATSDPVGHLQVEGAMHPARAGLLPRLAFGPFVKMKKTQNLDHSQSSPSEDAPGDEVLPEVRPVTHHQKLAVIDERLLYVGGLDLNDRRRDTLKHDLPSQETWADVQLLVSGPEAREAAHYLRHFQRYVAGKETPPEGQLIRRTISAPRRFGFWAVSPRTVLREIEDEGDLISRVRVPFHLTAEMGLSELDRASAMTRDFVGDTLCCGFVKIFLDGVIASGTAVMIDPYANRPGHRGDMLFTREDFIAAAVEIDRRGMQIAIHAIGDAAVRLALDGYEAAAKANGPRDRRHRIEHVEMLHPDDLGRFAELGVVASMQPPHAPVREDETTTGIGTDRAGMAYAWRTIADTGATVAFSSDWPIVPISPLAGIQAAMTRQNWAEGLPDQRLDLHDVLAAYTRNGAYVGYAEDLTGMIRPGMKADLALLSDNIETTQADRIGALEVDLTLFDGRVTHER